MLDNGKAPQSCEQPEGLINSNYGHSDNSISDSSAQSSYVGRQLHISKDDPRFAAFMVLRANVRGAVFVSGWTDEGYLGACHDVVMSLSKSGSDFMFGNEKFDLRFIKAANAGVTLTWIDQYRRLGVHRFGSGGKAASDRRIWRQLRWRWLLQSACRLR